MINFDFNKNCYGCKNCENACPVGAIKIIENSEGITIPKVDKDKCINCGKCDKVCPYLNNEKNKFSRKYYSAYLKSEKERETSASGGMFPAIAKYFIEKDGYVAGCIWDDNINAIHILTNKLSDIEKMKNSKYVQSNMSGVAKEIKEKLKEHKVLFVGTPCQTAAVKLYIGENKNLYTCSLICEGVPSNKVWIKYKEHLENKYKSKLVSADFRNKEIGWDVPVAKYKFKNGKVRKTLSFEFDKYVISFIEGLAYRGSCFNCQYKTGNNADIIIGDLWGASKAKIQETNYKGISAIIVNSEQGEKILKDIKEQMETEEISEKFVLDNNAKLISCAKPHINREKFFNDIDKVDIIENLSKNILKSKKTMLLKETLYKLKLYRKFKNILARDKK